MRNLPVFVFQTDSLWTYALAVFSRRVAASIAIFIALELLRSPALRSGPVAYLGHGAVVAVLRIVAVIDPAVEIVETTGQRQ